VTGKRVGAIRIGDNNVTGFQEVTLTGTGVPGTLKFHPPAIHFGRVPVGSTSSPAKTLTIPNKSGARAQILSITPPADFISSSDTCSGVTLDAVKSCTVDLAFKPATTGHITGNLDVTTDSARRPQHVKLSGVGVTS
jgi:hypothetical protein